MATELLQVSNKLFEGDKMSCSVSHEMHQIVREAASPASPGERVGAAISRAAKSLGLSYARARAHWYGLARLIPAEEADAMRARRAELREARISKLEHELAALRALRRNADDGTGMAA